jgi:signal transduction histidine kinase
MKISYLIFISIFFILALFSLTTIINYNQSGKVRENARFFSLSTNYVRQINQLQRNILDIERSMRGFLLTREKYLLDSYTSSDPENDSLFHELRIVGGENEAQKIKLLEIHSLYRHWITIYDDSLLVRQDSGVSAGLVPVTLLSRFSLDSIAKSQESLYNRMQSGFADLRNMEYENREVKRKILEDSEHQTKLISISLTGLSIIIGFIIAYLLARHISRRISTMVKMAESIAEGNYQAQVIDSDNDELSKLSNSLNHMADTLAENISMHQRKNRELDQFAHIVSHDLKAPLRGIDNVVTWIEEDYGTHIPPKVNEYLSLIKGRITRLENLIQGILSYALVGKEVQAKEEVDLKEMVLEIFENLPVKKGVTLDISCELPVFYANKIPLTQVLTNLISNSVKYHDKETGFVRVSCTEKADHYEFSVEDNGPGIAGAYHEKIFVIFQTLQERDSFESTGVGLAIVKKILEDRKEKITVTSAQGKGALFTFTWSKN